ncbi:unnamed protein product [Owenia fusiformis]|uniref:Nodulin-like domain-containing protein n=1 Tax=Owenia fusiformis TaxID=6347 RepID=A0A8S4NDI5_OWEFU|nr:unnamed protein product [Owenia fusiformis]
MFETMIRQKYVSLSVGILAWFMGGIVFAFNAYAIALKQTFNYTQTELDYVASSGDLAIAVAFPAGLMVDNFGPRVTCTVSLILTTLGFALMWIATQFKIFFATKSWLLCVFYFLASGGTIFIIVATKVVNCRNFERKHMGKILGLYSTIYGICPAIFSAIYEGLFVQGHIEDAENQKLSEFLIMLAFLSFCINLYAAILLKTESEEMDGYREVELASTKQNGDETKDATTEGHDNDPDGTKKEVNDKTELISKKTERLSQPDMTCWQIIKTIQFYYLIIISLIIAGVGGSFTNNITTVVKSASLERYAIIFTVVMPIFSSFGRFFGGMIPDFIFQKWPDIPKSSILLFPGICSCVGQVSFSISDKSLGGLIFSSMIMALAYGSFYTQNNLIAIQFFGLKYYGQNSGLIAIGRGIGILTFQKLFAFFYETNSPLGSKYCYGEDCYRWYFVLMAIICFCVVFLIFCLMKIERDQRLRHEEAKVS